MRDPASGGSDKVQAEEAMVAVGEACLHLLTRLRLPVAVLDQHGRVIVSSRGFDKATVDCCCVSVRDGAVEAGNGSRLAFEHLLRKAHAGDVGPTPATLEVAHDRGACAISVLPLPAPGRHVALFLSDHGDGEVTGADALQSRFGFTAAEARLAGALLAGQRLAGASRALGVSVMTVRSHLRSMFAKTHTHRQADLLRVLLRGAPPFFTH
jgi:DNA-binding CsgD family transcriptional regulator